MMVVMAVMEAELHLIKTYRELPALSNLLPVLRQIRRRGIDTVQQIDYAAIEAIAGFSALRRPGHVSYLEDEVSAGGSQMDIRRGMQEACALAPQ